MLSVKAMMNDFLTLLSKRNSKKLLGPRGRDADFRLIRRKKNVPSNSMYECVRLLKVELRRISRQSALSFWMYTRACLGQMFFKHGSQTQYLGSGQKSEFSGSTQTSNSKNLGLRISSLDINKSSGVSDAYKHWRSRDLNYNLARILQRGFNQQMEVQRVGHSSLKVHEPGRSLVLHFFLIFKNVLSALIPDPDNTVNLTEKTKMYSQLL